MVKFVRLCFVCDLYSVPAHGSNPVRARPVVSGFIRCFLRADELEKSYKQVYMYRSFDLRLSTLARRPWRLPALSSALSHLSYVSPGVPLNGTKSNLMSTDGCVDEDMCSGSSFPVGAPRCHVEPNTVDR